MVKCSDAEFAAFRKRQTFWKNFREGRTTSDAKAGGDGETPLVVPRIEPPISEALEETSMAREPTGAPEEAGVDRAGAAEAARSTGAILEPKIIEPRGGNGGAHCEA